ncbi:hypothetical protein [Mesorhizobium sp. ISC11]|uniref:hypothetical protein n=1 Tax=Mesorhizobium sp. ISC11 TaxID=3076428 RepID=UPI00301CE94C
MNFTFAQRDPTANVVGNKGVFTMRDWEDDYIEAWNVGGADAVNKLIKDRFPNAEDQVREALRLDDTGRWDVLPHESTRGPQKKIDRAVIMQYLG